MLFIGRSKLHILEIHSTSHASLSHWKIQVPKMPTIDLPAKSSDKKESCKCWTFWNVNTLYIQYMKEYVCVAYILYVNRIAVFLKYWTKWNEAIRDWSILSCCHASLMLRARPQFQCMRSCGDQIIPSAFHGLDCCITSDSRFWRIYLFRRYSIDALS